MPIKEFKGLVFIISGGICWGASGTMAQYMFRTQTVSPFWVTGIRLLAAGILLLLLYRVTHHCSIFSIWKRRYNWPRLLGFGLLGMMPSQLFYFLGINYSNAATATTLQFTSPIFIMGYLSFVNRRIRSSDVLSVIGVLFGTILLVTKGSFTTLKISPMGLICGLLGGAAGASYTLIPLNLVDRYNPELLCGWAMILGGLPLFLWAPFTRQPEINFSLSLELLMIVIIGTIVAYSFYISSLRYLSPMVTGILSSVEPLTTTCFSILVLKSFFDGMELLGGAIIIGTVIFTIIFSRQD